MRTKGRPRRSTAAKRILGKYIRRVKARRARRARMRRAGRATIRRSIYRVMNPSRKGRGITVQRTTQRVWTYSGNDAQLWKQWTFQPNYDATANPVGLLGWSNYAALFRQHKVVGIKLIFNIRGITGGYNTTSSYINYPQIQIANFYDVDLEATNADYNRLSQQPGLRCFQFSEERMQFEHRIYPKIMSQGTYDSSSLYTTYSPQKPRWFDVDYPYAIYYGVMWYMPNLPDAFTLDVGVEWIVKFARPRYVDPNPLSSLVAPGGGISAEEEQKVMDEMIATK